jgi:hypothetical protein
VEVEFDKTTRNHIFSIIHVIERLIKTNQRRAFLLALRSVTPSLALPFLVRADTGAALVAVAFVIARVARLMTGFSGGLCKVLLRVTFELMPGALPLAGRGACVEVDGLCAGGCVG